MSKLFREVKLSEVCRIKGGKRLPKGHALVKDKTSHPYIKARDIRGGKIRTTELEFLEHSTFEKIKRYIVNTDDVCITIVANIGDVGIVPPELNGANLTENAVKLTDFDKAIDPHFLCYQLACQQYKEQMEALSAGAAQSKLGIYKIANIKVKIPSFESQRKIASILSAYDDLIENNKRRIAILEKMAEEIYREWFVRMRFPASAKATEGKPAVVSGGDKWKELKIHDIASFKYGFTESACEDDSLPKFLRVMDINKTSYISWNDVPNCPIKEREFEKYSLRSGDILIARMADPGKIAIVEEDVNAVFASYLIKIVYDCKKVTPYYLFYTLRTDYYQGLFAGANSGATRGSINANAIGNTSIRIPSIEIMKRFDDLVFPLRKQIQLLLKSSQLLAKTRDLLLPRLISGKLSVEDLELPSNEKLTSATSTLPQQEPANA